MHRIGGTNALFSKKVHRIGLTDRYRCTVSPMQIAAIQTDTATLHRSGFTVDLGQAQLAARTHLDDAFETDMPKTPVSFKDVLNDSTTFGVIKLDCKVEEERIAGGTKTWGTLPGLTSAGICHRRLRQKDWRVKPQGKETNTSPPPPTLIFPPPRRRLSAERSVHAASGL
ncbi:hypothetical protein PCASD_23597 [Puccinia coronata f. sp. avenae]|uniref:Uncharacterized protein n=1 Tax=Puccinia coronata f. sp. avenae TaxID=200324 RepID=A0A2N5S882_9BASI|nr:hypothetical protein PCASD_23597 [Puccinia coronata f. sp. avenae]